MRDCFWDSLDGFFVNQITKPFIMPPAPTPPPPPEDGAGDPDDAIVFPEFELLLPPKPPLDCDWFLDLTLNKTP